MERLRQLHTGDARPRVRRLIERQTVPLSEDITLKHNSEFH
jgi:hypothetical protein